MFRVWRLVSVWCGVVGLSVFGGIGLRGRFERRGIGGFVWRCWIRGSAGGRRVFDRGLFPILLQSLVERNRRGREWLTKFVSGTTRYSNRGHWDLQG